MSEHILRTWLISAGLLEPGTPPPTHAAAVSLPMTSPSDPAAARYAHAALRAEVDAVASCAEGGRNHALNKAAFALEQLVAAGYLDAHVVADALTDAARHAGLGDAEIARTIRSGTRAGAERPRQVALDPARNGAIRPAFTLVPETNGHATPGGGPEVVPPQVNGGMDLPAVEPSWVRIDLTPFADGTFTPPEAGVLYRTDGVGLFYPGTISWLQGETESMKSWVAQIVTAETIKANQQVLYIDYESGPAEVVARLRQLGVAAAQLATLLWYVQPTQPAGSLWAADDFRALLAQQFGVVIVDGVTDALGTEGKSLLDNEEVAAWMRTVLRPLAHHTGGAVIGIDHVTKSQDGRGRFAIGAQAKMSSLDGVAYLVEPITVLGRGLRGEASLRVVKDRPGAVRPRCGEYRPADRSQEAARIVIDATHAEYGYRVYPPGTAITDNRSSLERCVDALDFLDIDPEAGRRSVAKMLRAKGYEFGNSTLQAAIEERRKSGPESGPEDHPEKRSRSGPDHPPTLQ